MKTWVRRILSWFRRQDAPAFLSNINDLEAVMVLMRRHRVDSLEYGSVRLTVSRHDVLPETKQPEAVKVDDDETLFWSAQG